MLLGPVWPLHSYHSHLCEPVKEFYDISEPVWRWLVLFLNSAHFPSDWTNVGPPRSQICQTACDFQWCRNALFESDLKESVVIGPLPMHIEELEGWFQKQKLESTFPFQHFSIKASINLMYMGTLCIFRPWSDIFTLIENL